MKCCSLPLNLFGYAAEYLFCKHLSLEKERPEGEKKEYLLGFILFIVKVSRLSFPEIVSLARAPKSYLIYFRSNTYFVSRSLYSRVWLFYYPRLFLSVIYTHSQSLKDCSCCMLFSMQSFFHSKCIS